MGYRNLKSVQFNDSLIEIEKFAFAYCVDCNDIFLSNSLTYLVLPNSVTRLGKYAFDSVEIESLTLSDNLHEIPESCFGYNMNLKAIKIPYSLKRVDQRAFEATQIRAVTIPRGVEMIDSESFTALKYISLPSTLKEIASDFYHFEKVKSQPPYVEVHPDNPIFYAENGTLYFRETGKQVLDAPYKEEDNFHHEDGDCEHCCHHYPTTEEVTKAFEVLRPKAEAGDAEAQNSLGIILHSGDKWIEPNYEEGLEWIKKSAAQGYVPAMMDLADIYHEGRNIEVDYNECFRLLLMAAEQGDERGMNNLAACYEEGHGTPKDLQRALSWYKKALENGYFKAHEDIKRIEQQLNL